MAASLLLLSRPMSHLGGFPTYSSPTFGGFTVLTIMIIMIIIVIIIIIIMIIIIIIIIIIVTITTERIIVLLNLLCKC